MAENTNDTGRGSSGATGQSSTLSDSELEFNRRKAAADTLIRNSRLGVYGDSFRAPFTKQFKATIRSYHKDDEPIYDETDRKEQGAVTKALAMRLWTFFVYLIYSASIIVLWVSAYDKGPHHSNVYWNRLAAFAGMTVLAWLARLMIRSAYIDAIERHATKFAIYFFKELSSIHDHSVNAVQCSRIDHMMTASWPDRSAGWIKIALWYGRRYDDLNRYVSAVAWKVGSRYRWIEGISTALKLLVVAVVLGIAYLYWPTPTNMEYTAPLLIATAIYLFVTVLFWGVLPQKNNDYWSEKFREDILGFDKQKKHAHNQVAEVVATDKRLFMGGQRNVEKDKLT